MRQPMAASNRSQQRRISTARQTRRWRASEYSALGKVETNNSFEDQLICRSKWERLPRPQLIRHFPAQHLAARPYSRRPAAGWLTSDNSSYAAWGSSRLAAAMFSSRCLIEEVPGIGRITLDLMSNHAKAACSGLASRSSATFFTASCASCAWPSGAHGWDYGAPS
jgi:hypothetical protein